MNEPEMGPLFNKLMIDTLPDFSAGLITFLTSGNTKSPIS